MEFIDTHAHLYADEFLPDRQQVIERACKNGVNKIIMPAIDSKSHENMLMMASQNKTKLFPLMGLHPTSVDKNYINELNIVEQYLTQRSLFNGIGEIGIDLYWDKTYYEQQIDTFTTQIKWAKQLSFPVVIHTRNSITETLEALEPLTGNGLTGVFHCYSGNIEQAKTITNMGFFLGIGGVVTFKNSTLTQVIEQIDINHIVLETDSPYLAPTPYRGKRNESSYLINIAQKIADIKNMPIDTVAQITTKNARQIFSI